MNTTMQCSDFFTDSAKSRWGIWRPFQGSASHRSMILGHKASSPSSGGRENPSRARTACVPFVNRPFDSEIHGIVNFTQFCCVLLVTWCYRVLLSCYLRPK